MEARPAAAANYTTPHFGDDGTEDAYHQSGCSSLTDFVSSKNWETITLEPPDDYTTFTEDRLRFVVSGVREREEEREAGSFLRFLRALPASCTQLWIDEDVGFESVDEVSALWQAIASPLCTLRELRAYRHSSARAVGSAVLKHLIAEALLRNTSLQVLGISSDLCCEENFAPALISRSAAASSASSLKSLTIRLMIKEAPRPNEETPASDEYGFLSGLLTGLANNTISLNELTIYEPSFEYGLPSVALERQLVGEMLVTNASLTSLSVQYLRLSGEAVVLLFTALEKNLHLTSLSLWGCKGEEWPSISTVLDSLRVNGIITRLDLRYTPLQEGGWNEDGAIRTQLQKNRANVEHLKVLKSQGGSDQLVQPTTVRLFLCGLPYSGKTTLSRSLADWNTSPSNSSFTSNMRSHLAKLRIPAERTRGIEVTNLERDGVKVSLWDLAGQREFYSFHDYMLPNLTNEDTPSMFLFVWSPVEVDPSTGKTLKGRQLKENIPIERFKDDFKYWLMFIASKTLKSVKFRPKVLVAITRADKKEQTGFDKSWISDIFDQCQNEFKDYLLLDISGVFEVDARCPHKVKQLAVHIFDGASSLLNSVPCVYKACDDVRRLFGEIVHMRPLMTKDEFSRICYLKLGIDTIRMQEAIAYSLNNSGDLIYFKSTLLVVVDVKRFCHHIMGSLLHFGMNNEKQHHEHGVFPLKCLEELLEEEVNCTSSARGKHKEWSRFAFTSRNKQPETKGQDLKINGQDLVKLLIELGLACQRDGELGVFIPASLWTRHPRSQIQPRDYLSSNRNGILTYMGRRLRCKNSVCTFFTPGFFPALQVMFHDTYSVKRGGSVILKEDVIVFARDGVEVFMEFCHQEGESQFIDILVQSHLDFDHTVKWINEEVLGKVEIVCVGPRGLQGVELAHEVIRPACVENLMCLDERKTQAVSLEELRDSLKRSLEKAGSVEYCLKNAFHSWEGIVRNADPIINLLSNEEIGRIMDSFIQQFVMDVNDALGINIERDMCIEKGLENPIFSSTPSGKERGAIFNEVREVRKDFQEFRKDVQKMLSEMQSICNVVLPKVQQRMEELLRFSKEEEIGRLPRFFVVTKSEGMFRRIMAAIVPGLKNVRLELLCEHGPHLVANQAGLDFETLEDGLLKSGLPYIIIVLKVARVAIRVGAHVAVGLGDVVPDFTRVLALIEDTPKGLPAYTEPDSPFRNLASRTNFQEGQQWLRKILSIHECSTKLRIHEIFGLTCVRDHNSRIRWLCDEHRAEYKTWFL